MTRLTAKELAAITAGPGELTVAERDGGRTAPLAGPTGDLCRQLRRDREADERLRRHDPELHRRAQHLPARALYVPVERLRAAVGLAGQHRRASAPATAPRRGSRRRGASSGTAGTDPGDPDGESDVGHRLCAECAESCKAAERTCARCRKRQSRARAAERRPRPIWPASGIEPPFALAALMADPPRGALTEAVPA